MGLKNRPTPKIAAAPKIATAKPKRKVPPSDEEDEEEEVCEEPGDQIAFWEFAELSELSSASTSGRPEALKSAAWQ